MITGEVYEDLLVPVQALLSDATACLVGLTEGVAESKNLAETDSSIQVLQGFVERGENDTTLTNEEAIKSLAKAREAVKDWHQKHREKRNKYWIRAEDTIRKTEEMIHHAVNDFLSTIGNNQGRAINCLSRSVHVPRSYVDGFYNSHTMRNVSGDAEADLRPAKAEVASHFDKDIKELCVALKSCEELVDRYDDIRGDWQYLLESTGSS